MGRSDSREGPKVQRSTPQRSNFQQSPSGTPGEQPTLYDAICSNCGKSTKVIFPPEKGRAVYCKSCLKKLKADSENKNSNKNPNRNYESPEPIAAVTLREDVRVENISFSPKRRQDEQKPFGAAQGKPKRKEINLSELRKALEESLEKKDLPSQGDKQGEKIVERSDNQQDELQSRIEEEKEMDKSAEENEMESPKSPKSLLPVKNENPLAAPADKKKEIKPGETIKF
jgi:CxxC-x17-CxxC domain-containing protein